MDIPVPVSLPPEAPSRFRNPDHRQPVLVEQMLWLDIAVHDAALVRLREARATWTRI